MTVSTNFVDSLGDVGDFEAREHGTDYLDGMVFSPGQVI